MLLVGNEKAYNTLEIWSSGGRIPHAILIEGEKGSGRKTFAGEIAGAILCEGAKPPCGQCRHCIKAEKGIHPDISVYSGGEGARSFHIDTIRKMRADTSVRPNESDSRVFILPEAQNMSAQAQNALLKTIEEPVKGVHFILTCENREQLLPTIRSRVTAVTLQTPSEEACRELLPELAPGLETEAYTVAAAETGGNVGAALSLLQNENTGNRLPARQLLIDLLERRELDALAALRPYERDREGLIRFIGYIRVAAAGMITGRDDTPASVPAARLHQVVKVIDNLLPALEGNGNPLLLSTALCSEIREVLR